MISTVPTKPVNQGIRAKLRQNESRAAPTDGTTRPATATLRPQRCCFSIPHAGPLMSLASMRRHQTPHEQTRTADQACVLASCSKCHPPAESTKQMDQQPSLAADTIRLSVESHNHQSHSVEAYAKCIHMLQFERHVTCLWAASSMNSRGGAAQDMSIVDDARAEVEATTHGQLFWSASSCTALQLVRFEADTLRYPCLTLSHTCRAALFDRLISGYRSLIDTLISSMANFNHRREHSAPILDSFARLKEVAALESCCLMSVSRPPCPSMQPLTEDAYALVAVYTEERRSLARAILFTLCETPAIKGYRTRQLVDELSRNVEHKYFIHEKLQAMRRAEIELLDELLPNSRLDSLQTFGRRWLAARRRSSATKGELSTKLSSRWSSAPTLLMRSRSTASLAESEEEASTPERRRPFLGPNSRNFCRDRNAKLAVV